MARIFETLALTPNAEGYLGSSIAHGMCYDAELGWDSVPCLRLDGFTITVRDEETAKRLLDEAARLHASFTQVVIGRLQESANDKAASEASCTGTCAWQPCDTVDCCEFGAIDCPSRFVAGEAT